jgi:hypothetical protein
MMSAARDGRSLAAASTADGTRRDCRSGLKRAPLAAARALIAME